MNNKTKTFEITKIVAEKQQKIPKKFWTFFGKKISSKKRKNVSQKIAEKTKNLFFKRWATPAIS